MKTTINSIRFFLAFVTLFITGTTFVNGQALKLTPNTNAGANLEVTAQTRFNYIGNGSDGFQIRTDNATSTLSQGNDLLWLCFAQAQPNNPGIFGITSYSAGFGWDPCFQIRANGNVGIFNPTPSVALEIGSSGSVRQMKVNGNIVFGSDARMKENIKDLSNSLGKLLLLRSVSYNFKEDDKKLPVSEKFLKNGFDLEATKNIPKTNEYLLSRDFYGFLAQEVQTLFPDLVYADSMGMLSIDYIGIIPLLVEGLKEQQYMIEELSLRLAALEGKNGLRSSEETNSTTGIDALLSQCVLSQNAPNPFSSQTEIRYYLTDGIKSASICIFDMSGKMLETYPAHQGQNSVTIEGSKLQAGMYLYSLIADGKVVDTKRMVLTK